MSVNYIKQEKVLPKSATPSCAMNGKPYDLTNSLVEARTTPSFSASPRLRSGRNWLKTLGGGGWIRNLSWLWLGWLCLLGTSHAGLAQQRPQRLAQDLTVTNFLNPAAPLVRETLTQITGTNFTDEEKLEPTKTPTTLGGVQVMLDGVPQRLRSVTPTQIVFVLDAAGMGSRTLDVLTKADGSRRTQITLVNAWPSVIVQSTGNTPDAYLVLGTYTNGFDPNQNPVTSNPIPVGQKQPTLVTISGSGWRLATVVQVRLNGTLCPVVDRAPSSLFPGQDELVFSIPSYLAQVGVVDLIVTVAGRESNSARLVLGAPLN